MTKPSKPKGFLFDIRVLEVADHRGEFLGKLLAGAGADVVKVEPPVGAPTREIGPFYEDSGDPRTEPATSGITTSASGRSRSIWSKRRGGVSSSSSPRASTSSSRRTRRATWRRSASATTT